ncbi:MAG: trypsin-like peptidase domain-containing protein [Parcubacteria group bacterium]|nr:trypsin-like peptidase domain-containing protein [Parcubacteria group bacterium]
MLVNLSDSTDVALFRFQKKSLTHRKSFPLEDADQNSFSLIAAPGSPLGIDNTLGGGHIARTALYYNCDDEHRGYILSVMPSVNPGNSGGPFFNLETDKVNGMVTAIRTGGVNNSMACIIPASALIKFLEETRPLRK